MVIDAYEIKSLPNEMTFYYSKSAVISDFIMFSSATVAMFFLCFMWLILPEKKPGDLEAGILLGFILSPGALFFLFKSLKLTTTIKNIKRPAIIVTKTDFKYNEQSAFWHTIEKIEVFCYRTPFLIVHYSESTQTRIKKITINLNHIKEKNISEYVENYWNNFKNN